MHYRQDDNPRDQQIHAITQVLEFFGKGADADAIRMWLYAFQDYQHDQVMSALRESIKVCEFAPKPAKIIRILEERREQNRPQYQDALPRAAPPGKVAPPEVASAWRYLISQWGGSAAGMFHDPKLSEDEIEQAILLVNQQVKASGSWQSIPPHLWLDSLHGRPYPGEPARSGDTSDHQELADP